jgi:glycosyltransferase involved in cell wall biosynthesis
MNLKVSIVIPAYNEATRIANTIKSLKNLNEISEIIIVDDGSKDNTLISAKLEANSKVKVFSLDKNKGKGFALNYGLKQVSKDMDIIGFLDADLEDSASEVIKLIQPVIDNEADVVIAKFPSAKKKGGLGFVKRLAKESVLEMTGKELDATLSGQRIFKREVLEKFDEIPFGYGVEVGMTIDILNYGYRVSEILVNMTHNETGRNLKGFIHRGKQFYHIKKVLKNKKKELKNSVKK